MKKILLVCLVCMISVTAFAREVNGIKLADSVQLGNATLQLNGAGTRSKLFIDVYVAALYVGTKTHKAEDVLADTGAKRVALHVLYGMASSTLREAFKKGIEANNSAAELALIDAQLKKFYAIFDALSGISNGDVILLDYLPAIGTKVTINGTDRGIVEGAEMNRALLKVWLGNQPVQDDLKKDMLGG